MYEVEYKVEITEDEREALFELFNIQKLHSKPSVVQHNYHIEMKESPLGGFNVKRYRDEGEKCFYTEKIWESLNGENIRKEIEKEVPREELECEIAKYPDAVKITKGRQSFESEYKGKKIHIDMDNVKFDHSPSMRFFIEGEIITTDNTEVKSLRALIIEFLKETLGKSELKEAPGMISLVTKKL